MMIPDEGHPATPCSDATRDALVASEVVEVPADIVEWRRGIRTSVHLFLLSKTHSFKTSLLTMIIAQHAGRQQDTHRPGAVLSSKHYANAWTGQSHRLRRRTTSTTICQDSRSIWRATRKNKKNKQYTEGDTRIRATISWLALQGLACCGGTTRRPVTRAATLGPGTKNNAMRSLRRSSRFEPGRICLDKTRAPVNIGRGLAWDIV